MGTQATRKNGSAARNTQTGVYGHLFGDSTSKTGLDSAWNQVDPTVLQNIVWAIDAMGGSVTIGSNRKGTAYFFKVYIGQPYPPMYFDGDEEGRAAMREWADRLVEAAANAV